MIYINIKSKSIEQAKINLNLLSNVCFAFIYSAATASSQPATQPCDQSDRLAEACDMLFYKCKYHPGFDSNAGSNARTSRNTSSGTL